ncbi:MAG: tol-pal system protein YbgF [Alphaproteobacteria bacterium]|nr:tol-pal system protein YbgF [Alphaproteobacteria bacterium]
MAVFELKILIVMKKLPLRLLILVALLLPAAAAAQRVDPVYIEDRLNQLQQAISILTGQLEQLQYRNQQLQQQMEKMQADYEFRLDQVEKGGGRPGGAPAVRQKGFRAFVQRNPQHALAGNAQYWLGETYYARRDYQNAMTAFAEGYKNYKASPKGPDNLLKLGVTLAMLGRKTDGCAIFARFAQDYPRATDLQKRRVEQERQKNGCG